MAEVTFKVPSNPAFLMSSKQNQFGQPKPRGSSQTANQGWVGMIQLAQPWLSCFHSITWGTAGLCHSPRDTAGLCHSPRTLQVSPGHCWPRATPSHSSDFPGCTNSQLPGKNQGAPAPFSRLRCPNMRLQGALAFDIEIDMKKALPRNNRKLGKRHMLQKI